MIFNENIGIIYHFELIPDVKKISTCCYFRVDSLMAFLLNIKRTNPKIISGLNLTPMQNNVYIEVMI